MDTLKGLEYFQNLVFNLQDININGHIPAELFGICAMFNASDMELALCLKILYQSKDCLA